MITGARKNQRSQYKADFVVILQEESVNTTTDILQLFHKRWGHQHKEYVKQELDEINSIVKLDDKIGEDCI